MPKTPILFKNKLLAALPRAEYARLLPDLEHVHFPEDALVQVLRRGRGRTRLAAHV